MSDGKRVGLEMRNGFWWWWGCGEERREKDVGRREKGVGEAMEERRGGKRKVTRGGEVLYGERERERTSRLN